jgi:hypothetical protein
MGAALVSRIESTVGSMRLFPALREIGVASDW